MMFVLELLACLVLSVAAWSLTEYAVHRWIMHHPRGRSLWIKHAVLHHGWYFPKNEFVGCTDPASKYISIQVGFVPEVLFGAVVWGPLSYCYLPAGLVFLAVSLFHWVVWWMMHTEMHFPTHKFLGDMIKPWTRYHQIHHEHPGRNYNAVFPPLGDWLFGTLVWE